jgi:acetolactate decarboxylase
LLKKNRNLLIIAILITIFFAATYQYLNVHRIGYNNDILFQTSTINALLEGIYDGPMNYAELKKHGDIGIGTFNGLEGEMIGINGEFYQIKVDGRAYPVNDSMYTPFAMVTFFESDKNVKVFNALNFTQLEVYLDDMLPTQNIFISIKIDGTFDYVKTRSVPKQSKPYPPLTEAVKNQSTFEFHNVEGVIVGFRTPEYMEGVNVPGYHFHFINKDRTAGGHLLQCQVQNVNIEIDYTSDFYMSLPENSEFYEADLMKDQKTEIEEIEKQ